MAAAVHEACGFVPLQFGRIELYLKPAFSQTVRSIYFEVHPPKNPPLWFETNSMGKKKPVAAVKDGRTFSGTQILIRNVQTEKKELLFSMTTSHGKFSCGTA